MGAPGRAKRLPAAPDACHEDGARHKAGVLSETGEAHAAGRRAGQDE